MTRYQNAVVSMAKSTYGTVSSEDAEPLLEDFASVNTVITKLGEKIDAIEDLVLTQTDISAASEEKQQSRKALITLTNEIVGAILSYAHSKEDKRLEKKASLILTNLPKARDSRLVAFCRGAHKMAAPLTQSLKSSKITAEKIASLKTQTDAYKKDYTKPRQAIAVGKAATKRLPVLVRQVSTLLRKGLDPLLVQFKETDPEFHAKYRAARRIVRPSVSAAAGKKTRVSKKPATATTPSTVNVPKAA